MEIPAERPSDEIAGLFESAFETPGETFYLVNPTAGSIEALVEWLASADERPDARLVGEKRVLSEAMADFVVAARAADLVESDALSMRAFDDSNGYSSDLVVTESTVTAVLRADDALASAHTDDEEFVEEAYDERSDLFEESDPYRLQTPPLSRVESTLESELGPDCRDDFEAFLSNLRAARGDDRTPDGVDVSLLVAARNRVQFYHVARWAEEAELASKATLSRKKNRLEERGWLATEKVPSDVGRPRLRLVLGDDRLRDVSVPQLASVVQNASE